MPIDITITIPGDLSDPTSPMSRLKAAIDWQFGDDPDAEARPQSPAEYKQFVADWLVNDLNAEVLRQERNRKRAQLIQVDPIDIQSS